MRFVFLSVLGAILLGACATNNTSVASNASAETPATAAESTEEATAAGAERGQETAELDEDRVICKRIIQTGSRFKKNVCRPWSEWKRLEEESSRNVDTLQRRMRGQVSGQ